MADPHLATVAVIGAGTMGNGIAQTFASYGTAVRLEDRATGGRAPLAFFDGVKCVNQCRREEDPTLLTARQSTDGLVGELTDVQIGHDALAPVPDLRGRYSIHARTEGEKVFDRPRR